MTGGGARHSRECQLGYGAVLGPEHCWGSGRRSVPDSTHGGTHAGVRPLRLLGRHTRAPVPTHTHTHTHKLTEPAPRLMASWGMPPSVFTHHSSTSNPSMAPLSCLTARDAAMHAPVWPRLLSTAIYSRRGSHAHTRLALAGAHVRERRHCTVQRRLRCLQRCRNGPTPS